MAIEPEAYTIKPTPYTPNSRFPVLVYREAIPLPVSETTATKLLESYDWVRQGMWGHIPIRHFHPNSHECYGIFQGSSTLLLGQGKCDPDGGLEIELSAGDVIVLPAGVAHCNLQSTLDFKYIGVYPKGAPKWRTGLGNDAALLEGFQNETKVVAMPTQDPVNGADGPLIRLWRVDSENA